MQRMTRMTRMTRAFVFIAALLGLTAVAAGAFGAHALEQTVTPERLKTWQTASAYHLTHALALLAVAWWSTQRPGRWIAIAGGLVFAGTLVFSGSLYALVLADAPKLGAVTPFGGVMLMLGWLMLAISALTGRR